MNEYIQTFKSVAFNLLHQMPINKLSCDCAIDQILSKRRSCVLKHVNGNHLHHIIPISLGGRDCIENTIVLTPYEHYIIHFLRYARFDLPEDMFACLLLRGFFSDEQMIEISEDAYNFICYEQSKQNVKRLGKPVFSILPSGVVDGKFDSVRAACRFYNQVNGSIKRCVKHLNYTAFGHFWRYVSDFPNLQIGDHIQVPRLHGHSALCHLIDVYKVCDNDVCEYIETIEGSVEIAKKYGMCTSAVTNCLSGRYRQSGGFTFRHTQTNREQTFVLRKTKIDITNKHKRIAMLDLSTNTIIKEFDSANKAGKYLNCPSRNICACARGETKQSHGYGWKYID